MAVVTDPWPMSMGGNSYPFRYTYTDLDHRASMRYPSNTLVNEVPNDLGWPTQLTGFTRSNSEILYHPNGTPKQITFVNSQTWATTLKPRQWIATIKGNNGSLLNLGYTYDLRGNLTSLSDTATGGQSLSLQYDGVDRLTYASGPQPWGYERYYYENGRGDLTRRLSSNWTIHFSYNSSGQLTSTTAPLTASYRYDNRGNITEDADWRYAYNYAGELRAVYPQTVASWQPPASQWAYGYAYDANGQRVAKAVLGAGGRNEVSAYGQNGRLLLYDNDAHSGWREQVYLGDRLVAQRRSSGGVRTFYLTDALGSPRVASSAYGAVLWRENYRPWGQRNTKSADMQTDPLAYTAQPFDDETSLLYLGARYHHVKIGRFYQMDPVHFAEDNSHSFNRFAYANNNPYKFVDPEGLSPSLTDDEMDVADDISGGNGGQPVFGNDSLGGPGLPIGPPSGPKQIPSRNFEPRPHGSDFGPSVGSPSGVTKGTPDITKAYKRPSGATTKAQRESVQGKPCVDCGVTTSKQVADHKDPLVREYYRTGTIDKTRMRDVDSVQPQCPTCSARQGAEMSRFSRQMKKEHGLE